MPRRPRSQAMSGEMARLFTVTPRDFIRERNSIAARLRAAGRRAEAAQVQGVAKPTIALWAVNQAARHAESAVAELLASTDRLRRGASDAGEVRAAIAGERRAIDALQQAARASLGAAGFTASTDVVRRIATTLRGAAADRAGRDELREGRLTHEWEAPGFELLAGTRLPALRVLPGGRSGERPARPRARQSAPERPVTREAPDSAREARTREAAEAAAAERERRERHASELDRLAGERRKAAERADQEVADTARRLKELRAGAAAARRAAAQAERTARGARRALTVKGRRPSP